MRIAFILWLLCPCSQGAQFGGNVQRWFVSNSVTPTVITLTNGIAARSIGILALGYEASFSMNVTNVSDSRGNTWTIGGHIDYSSVHRGAMAWSYLNTALVANDTISITWSNHPSSTIQKGGGVFYLSGCASIQPDITVYKASAGSALSASGTNTVAGDVLFGMMVVDGILVTNYLPAWNAISPRDDYGHSDSTDGLASYYFYTNAGPAGAYDPGGTVLAGSLPSWGVLWMAFNPSTITRISGITMKGINIH